MAIIGGSVVGYRSVAVAYSGPGDIVSGAIGWWGLRAYSSATIGNNAVRLRESGGNTEQDFATIAGGGLDLAAIATFKGANNLFVVKLYDQSGNARDISESSASRQPSFILSGLGSLPVMRSTIAASTRLFTSSFVAASQPFTLSAVAKRTGGIGANATVLGRIRPQIGFQSTSGLVYIYGGVASPTASASEGDFHALHGVFNGASSDLNVDGTVNTVDVGVNGFATTTIEMPDPDDNPFTGDFVESGVWNTAFTSTQSTNMSANQHAYWGF